MTAAHQIREWIARIAVEGADGGMGGRCGLLAVAQTVHDSDERAGADALDQAEVARLFLPRQGHGRERRVDLQMVRRHFFMVIVVPRPTTESTSNSSIRRLAPGSPAPTPCDVE